MLLTCFTHAATCRQPDGTVGFVQMDVSLSPSTRDVRVITFEDRHDCMKCLSVLRQWPGMEARELSMGAMPSDVVEAEIRCADVLAVLPVLCACVSICQSGAAPWRPMSHSIHSFACVS